jgi:hypothetical protein
VSRSVAEIVAFLRTVSTQSVFERLELVTLSDTEPVPSARLILQDLCAILQIAGDDVWCHDELVDFFDTSLPSRSMSKLHMLFLTQQVRSGTNESLSL